MDSSMEALNEALGGFVNVDEGEMFAADYKTQ